jgi:ribosomal protein L44E
MAQTPESRKASLARYRTSAKGKASQARHTSTEKFKAQQRCYRSSDRGRAVMAKINAKQFRKFKKGLTVRIECLRNTSPLFREARIQEILAWAGSRHSYWVETEIQNAC